MYSVMSFSSANNNESRYCESDSKLGKTRSSYFVVKDVNKSRYIFVDLNRYGIIWSNVFIFFVLHVIYFASLYELFRKRNFGPWFFGISYALIGITGVTVGAHRLWSHKSFKAKLPLRVALMIMQTIAGQNDLYTWCRDHRLHHKFSETDADVHNSKRGFFFTHMGWLMTKKHPDVIIKGETVDCSDLLNDPVIAFQRKYYTPLFVFWFFIFPSLACRYCFGCSWIDSLLFPSIGKYVVSLHMTWFVNSAAHMFGDRPYNLKIAARENIFVSLITWGSEGWHNYHHAVPFDYTISELGWKINPYKWFIEFMAKVGQAYGLRRPSKKLIENIKENAANKKLVDPYKEPHAFC